jgi:hypothetical protein
MKRVYSFARSILQARSGVAALEFALILPFLTITGLYGSELAWYMLVNMRASQVAMQVADNASRIGDTSTLTSRKIYESDINDIMIGANLDGGSMLKLLTNGRVIVSSLEVDPSNNQYIHWQRCKGLKNVTSSYGVAGDLKPGGMGPTGHKITALTGDAAIFVEVVYDYQPLFSSRFITNRTITALASFNVRDSRDLTQVYQTNPASTVSSCSTFSAT